jgi:hypothetical protein
MIDAPTDWRSSGLGRLIYATLALFIVTTLLVGTTFLNKAVFGALVFFVFIRVVTRPDACRVVTFAPIVVALIFMYGFVVGLLSRVDPALSRQLLFSVSILFLIYPLVWFDIDLDPLLRLSGVILAAFSLLFLASVLAAPLSGIAASLLSFFVENNLGFAAEREFLESPIQSFQLGTVPFLLLPLAIFADAILRSEKVVLNSLAFLSVLAVVAISGARGLMLVSLLLLASLLWLRVRVANRVVLVLVAVPIAVVAFSELSSSTQVFSPAEQSNSIKLGHIRSFVDNFSVRSAIFGDGLGAYYYSSGRGREVAETEITLLDMVRYFGVIATGFLYASLLLPAARLSRYRRAGVFAPAVLAAYLVLSLSNPVLWNSSGLLVVVWYWLHVLREPRVPA